MESNEHNPWYQFRLRHLLACVTGIAFACSAYMTLSFEGVVLLLMLAVAAYMCLVARLAATEHCLTLTFLIVLALQAWLVFFPP